MDRKNRKYKFESIMIDLAIEENSIQSIVANIVYQALSPRFNDPNSFSLESEKSGDIEVIKRKFPENIQQSTLINPYSSAS